MAERKSGQHIVCINMTRDTPMTRGEMGFNEASETLSFSFGRWAEKCRAPQHIGCDHQVGLRPADAEGFTPHPSGLGSVCAEDCTHAAKRDLNTVAPDPFFLCFYVLLYFSRFLLFFF